MNKYTVMILYPESVANHYGETYTAHILAPNVHDATRLAKLKLANETREPFDDEPSEEDLDSLDVVAVYAEFLQDLKA